MYSNVVPFKTKKFPNEGIWRVHAFGEVRRNPNISSEALVDLFIVPLINENCSEKQLNSSSSYDYSRLQPVQIGVGQIAGICVGSLLRDQKRIYRLPEYDTATVIFNSARNFEGIIRAGDDYSNNQGSPNPTRIFPSNHYRIPEELRGMPCLTFSVKKESVEKNGKVVIQDDLLMIPCWVVLQYYFATSSRLVNSLINGDLERGSNLIFNPVPPLTYHNEEDGFFHLRLRQRMFNKDVSTIARIAADERITQDAANIYNSMVANFNSGKGAFPEVRLPFFGDTRMKVHGKNIGNGRDWFFFVYYIESCSGEYSYERLKFDRDNDATKSPIENPFAQESWNGKDIHKSKTDEPKDGRKIQDDKPPSLTVIETTVTLPRRKFTAQPNDVRKIMKEISEYRSAAETIWRNNGTEKGLSTGSGESGGESGELNIETDPEHKERKPRESAPPDFDSMLEVLETIRRRNPSEFDYELLPVIEDTRYEASDFSVFPGYFGGKRIAWSFMLDDPSRRRQVLVAEIVFRDKYFYLFEIERRLSDSGEPKENFNTFLLHENLGRVEKLNFEKILFYMANNRGVYTDEWEFSTIAREKFKHGWKIEDFSKTLHKFFGDEVAKQKPIIDKPKTDLFRETDFLDDSDVEQSDFRPIKLAV